MKKFRSLIVKTILSSFLIINYGCYTSKYNGKFDINLHDVQVESISKANLVVNADGKYFYADSIIKIMWSASPEGMSFKISNLSESTIKIIWDDAAMVDQDGQSQGVTHKGTRIINRDQSQKPSVIVKKSTYNDIIVKTDDIYWFEGNKNEPAEWRINELYKFTDINKQVLNKKMQIYDGKIVKILLPIEIEDQKYNYLFNFKFENPIVNRDQEFDKVHSSWIVLGVVILTLIIVI